MSKYYEYRPPRLEVGRGYAAINTGDGIEYQHLKNYVIILEEDRSLTITTFLGDDGIWYTENGQGLGITRYLTIEREEITLYI